MKQSQAVEIVNTRKQMMKREPSPKHCITNSNNKVMFLGPQKNNLQTSTTKSENFYKNLVKQQQCCYFRIEFKIAHP